jgi:hypothetical protein
MTGDDVLRIGASFDVAAIQAGMAQGAGAVTQGTEEMAAGFDRVATASEVAEARVRESMTGAGYSVTEARHAIHGLGEEIGLHVPRFVQSFVAELGGVGPALASAFSVIAVVGLAQVLSEIPELLDKGIEKLHGWDAEAKKAFSEATRDAIGFQHEQVLLNEQIAKVGLIGKSGPEKAALELQIMASTTAELKQLQDQYNHALEQAELPTTGYEAKRALPTAG